MAHHHRDKISSPNNSGLWENELYNKCILAAVLFKVICHNDTQ